jgi:hypothetical protein
VGGSPNRLRDGLVPVDVAPVADADHLYQQAVVVDFVDDPAVTDAYSVHIVLPHQSDAFRRPGFAGKQVDDRSGPLLLIAW